MASFSARRRASPTVKFMGAAYERWNHNIHYHRVILDAVPPGARSALDVGTGNGLLAVDVRRAVPEVVGIDLDEAVLESARSESEEVTWLHGDVMNFEFGRTFDVVASIAALHHLPDLEAALRRLADLTTPGGVLAIVGLARASRPSDFARHLVGLVQHAYLIRRHGKWTHTAPIVWPPPHDFRTVRRVAEQTLPGVDWTHLPMWRYALVWRKQDLID